ncbi:MAG: tRNA pseudouridine(55) synthase TruB [Coriobacteriia bacterium]|nr:tRNA pseudouridine(55) synthase TruB [Coriobacteriia bacterium]
MIASKRGATGLSGIIAVDKPAGLTSHDIVNRIRRITRERRVGHCGTLDPFATGLLMVCIGPATRLADYLMGARKRYVARISFGVLTDTDDCEGAVVEVCPLDGELFDKLSSFEFAQGFLAGLVGRHEQIPPSYSAIQRDGVRSYDAARRGDILTLKARPIEVYAAELLGILAQGDETPLQADATLGLTWDVAFEVSKGTYIRALARDIAGQLGTCGHLAALRRTSSGQIGLADAYTLEAIEARGVEACFLDPVCALGLPTYVLDAQQRADVLNGRPLTPDPQVFSSAKRDGSIVACICDDAFFALYRYDEGQGNLRALAVIPGAVRLLK